MSPIIAFKRLAYVLASLAILLGPSASARAASAAVIDTEVNEALAAFQKIEGARAYLSIAKGVLVFPKVYKAGIGIGGEYGEGALRIGGQTVDYYSTAAASVGFQLGAQAKTMSSSSPTRPHSPSSARAKAGRSAWTARLRWSTSASARPSTRRTSRTP